MDALSDSDKDLMNQVCGFAERRATNGVWLNFMRSESRGNLPFIVVVAMGEQAEALQQIILGAQAPQDSPIQVVSSLDSIEAAQW